MEDRSFFDEIKLEKGKDFQVALELEDLKLELVVPLTLEAYLRYGNSLKNEWVQIDAARNSLEKNHAFILVSSTAGLPVCYTEFNQGGTIDCESLFEFFMYGAEGEKIPYSQTNRDHYKIIFDFLKDGGFIEKPYVKKFMEITLEEFEYKQRRVAKFFKKIVESEESELFKKFLKMNRYDLGMFLQECTELTWNMELVFMDELTAFFMDAFWRGKGVYVERSKFNEDDYFDVPPQIVENIRKSFVSEPRLIQIPTNSRKKKASMQEIIAAAEEFEKIQLERKGVDQKSGDFVDYFGTKNIDKIKKKHGKLE